VATATRCAARWQRRLDDVRNGLVSPQGAALEYGVVLDANGQVDETATRLPAPRADRRTIMRNQYRLGIDAGGTFTDFILADRDGGVQLFKAPPRRRTAPWPFAPAWRRSPTPPGAARPN
jgi:hypothetical protein